MNNDLLSLVLNSQSSDPQPQSKSGMAVYKQYVRNPKAEKVAAREAAKFQAIMGMK